MAQIKVTRRSSIRTDHNAAAQAAAAAIIQHNTKRATAGDDVMDRKVPGYSSLYLQQLGAIGASTSPSARLAAIVKRLKVLRISTTNGRTQIQFDIAGTVKSTPRPPPYVFDRRKTPEQRALALANWKQSPKRSEVHDVDRVLGWLARQTSDRPARRIIGISPKGHAEVSRAIERARVFVSK